ncbi:RNA polymerase sigma factor [Marinimicrobium sp. ABcell2]|uniref:RNA polymerase sigma factor n=1 Tax=Marinimicrobium sp. ABcell2 TaxID=3069751 RepID=UPI0027B4E2C5|nr:RNA polymerase sigma factor [Marinimicrobium sp. ABcell2]MDQ2076907.1 RNA polymerase sigma factor [Marinimicrobium sp. ABcell2]
MPTQVDQNDFEKRLRPYAKRCYQTAYRLTGSRVDTEDVVQELFIKLYQRFDQWSDMEDATGWIMRVLYNVHVDLYRKKAKTHGINEQSRETDDGALDQLVSGSSSPEDAAENSQQQSRILAALGQLDADQRALVTLHLLEGYTLDEAATILETPVGTLKSRLHRTKAQLKKLLKLQPFSKK